VVRIVLRYCTWITIHRAAANSVGDHHVINWPMNNVGGAADVVKAALRAISVESAIFVLLNTFVFRRF
jgi:hypothetical protein